MKHTTPIKAIRIRCLDCAGGQPSEVRYCSVTDCSLYQYRFGKNPLRSGIGKKKGCFCRKTPTQPKIS